MAIEDSNPERRNLVVASLAFVAYYYGGGELKTQEVTLELVNVHFSNLRFLAFMAWAALFWFLYRYRLLHSGEFRKHFRSELQSFQSDPGVARYASRRVGQEFPSPNSKSAKGGFLTSLRWNMWRVEGHYIVATDVRRNAAGMVESYTQEGEGGIVALTDLRGWLVALRITVLCFFRKPSFSSYFVPYILFCAALIGPLYRHGF